jgi:transposase InsO family protein
MPNQIVESFNSRVRDECLNEHVLFLSKVLERKSTPDAGAYNNINLHSALGMKSPIEFVNEQESMLAS